MPESGNIILFGFMGTGKSAVARRLGETLNLPVVEMDSLIEEREGKTISRIFAERGEGYFRQLERELVREISARRGAVIATGGGVALNPDNVRDLSRSGLPVCLTARPGVILARVAGETHRPLLEGRNPEERIERLLQVRQPYYRQVSHQVDTSDLSVEEVAGRIIALMGSRE